ncbi:MAG: 16S rRNA (cytosine(1402)-N(4))-methyltransferase, partial [Planctomycetota bacterium]|nr:16S rRNA (cytosine(1402)-N(4))-methyltransferase [Planctomycetota bacterium]
MNDRRVHSRPVPAHARPTGAAPRVLTLSVFDAMTDPLSDRPVHVPVLAEEVARLLGGRRPADSVSGLLVDVTLGAGGHSALLLERFPRLRLLG